MPAVIEPPMDGKSATAFRTIGEVAQMLSIRAHVLRYWEEQFPMLRPLKRAGGRRYYRPEDVILLATIDRLVHREGYTLRGARLAIEAEGKARGQPVPIAPQPQARYETSTPQAVLVDDLRAIRDRLALALARDLPDGSG